MLSNGALTKGLMGTKLTHTNWKSFPLYLDNIIYTIEIIKKHMPRKNIPFQKLCSSPPICDKFSISQTMKDFIKDVSMS